MIFSVWNMRKFYTASLYICPEIVNFWQSYLKNKKVDVFGTQYTYDIS